jgi:hypothetical protein
MAIQFDPFVASQGLAAGLAGKLPEFQQTQNQKAQVDLEKKKQDDEMQIKIQESQFKDAYAAQQLLASEDYDGIVKLGITRLSMLQGLNANPAETQRVLQIAIAARNGDPEARKHLKGELDSAVKIGVATGVLKAPEKEGVTTRNPEYDVIDAAGNVIQKGTPEATSYKSEVDALGVRRYTEGPNIGEIVPGFGAQRLPGSEAANQGQADTISFPDGSVKMILPDQSIRYFGPDGEEIKGAANIEEFSTRTQGLEETRLATEKANVAKATDAVKFSNAAFEQSDFLRSNKIILNQALEALNEGASSGPFQRLLPVITDAGAKLQAAQSRLGLNIVQETTFGALSKGELDLALKIGLPDNLTEEPLAQYIKDKMIASEKLAAYLDETGDYLAIEGNNLAGWRKLKREELNETKKVIKFALDNPLDERSAGILADPRSITVLEDNPDLRMR